MKRPDDHDWDRLVERIELDASDADLAAAEEALSGAEAEEVRPELVEAVMARVRAEAAEANGVEHAEIPILRQPQPIRAFPRFRRLAAAAAAFLFGTKLSAATTVTVAAAAVVTTVVLWSGRFSREELSYENAVKILQSDESSEQQVHTSLGVVMVRTSTAVETLGAILDDSGAPRSLHEAITTGARNLLQHGPVGEPGMWMEISHSASTAADSSRSESERLFYIQNTLSLVGVGVEGMRNVKRFSPDVQEMARKARQKVRDAVSRLLR